MRKLFLLVAILAVMLPGSAIFAQTETTDLASLAAFYPDDTLLYVVSRIDDDFRATLDTLVGAVSTAAGQPTTVTDLLNQTMMDGGLEGTYDEVFAPWLGDHAAIGVAPRLDNTEEDLSFYYSLDEEVEPNMAVVQITDSAAAVAYVESVIGDESESGTLGDFTTFRDDDFIIAIGADVMFFGFTEIIEPAISGDFTSLAENSDLAETAALLPESAYNAMIYGNQPATLAFVQSAADAGSEEAAEQVPVIEGASSFAAGATIVDGTTLTIDAATGQARLISLADVTSVNTGFAANIPAGTPLVIHSADLAGIVATAINLAQEAGAGEDVNFAQGEIETAVQGATGLSLQTDIIGWMTSDFALTLGTSESAGDLSSFGSLFAANPVDLAFLADASGNPEAAVAVIDAAETSLNDVLPGLTESEDVQVTYELTREGNTLTLIATDQSGNVPFPVTIILGVNDDNVFFLGTPGATAVVTGGDVAGLDSTDAFAAAAGTLLPEPEAIYFADLATLRVLANAARFAADEEVADTADGVLALFSNATISAATDANGNSLVRATISLAE